MRYLIGLIICAYSQDIWAATQLDRTEINNTLSTIHSVPLPNKGQDGIWFPKADAELLLDLVSGKFRLALDTIDEQTTEISALTAAVNSLKVSNQSYQDLANLNKQMFDTAMATIPKLVPPAPAWYENSKATYVYGVVTGGILVFGTTYLATQTFGHHP